MLTWLRDLWVILGLTLLLVLAVDAALREFLEPPGWAPVRVGAEAPPKQAAEFYRDHAWAEQYWREHRDAKAMRWEPLVYWRRQAFAGEAINVDAQGIRLTVPHADQPAPEVWVMGGSSVWGTGVSDPWTLPSRLAASAQDAGLALQVINLGESGYVSSQSLALLQKRLRAGHRPDVVVFVEGANDVYAALQGAEPGTPQNEFNRARDFGVTDGVENWLLGFPRVLEGFARLVARAPESPPDPKAVVQAWLENVTMARALGRQYNFETIFFWQPTVFTKPRRSAHEQAALEGSARAHQALQLATNTLVAGRADIQDLSDAFAQTEAPVFSDFVHLGPTGNEVLADLIYPHIERLIGAAEAAHGRD